LIFYIDKGWLYEKIYSRDSRRQIWDFFGGV
jgi:hypothetical protein